MLCRSYRHIIVDGYLGIYDTVYVTAGEYEEKIEPDRWLRQERMWATGVSWGEKVFFRYEVNNRKFSTYSTTIQVSVWKENEKVMDSLAEVAVPRDLFAAILGRITKLCPSPS